jgi:hypothetical protein
MKPHFIIVNTRIGPRTEVTYALRACYTERHRSILLVGDWT